MGAGIPLPALDVQQFQQESPATAMAKVEQVRAAQQQREAGELQLQQQRLELNDQQAMTRALHDWDGKDMNELPGLVTKNGGSAKAVLGLRSSVLDYQTKQANKSKLDLENENTIHNQVAGALSPGLDPKQVADADLPNWIRTTGQGLLQSQKIDPQHEQTIEQLATMDPTAARTQLGNIRKGFLGQSAINDELLKSSEVQKNLSQSQADRFKYQDGAWYDVTGKTPTLVNGNAANPDQFHAVVDQIAPPDGANRDVNMMTKAAIDFDLKQGRLKDAQEELTKAQQSVTQRGTETNPAVMASKIRLIGAEAQARQQAAQGDPKVAGKLLADGDLTLADLKTRGSTPQFIEQATLAAKNYRPTYNAADEVISEQVAKSPAANQFFGSANSLISKGGTLDQLTELGKQIPQHDFPVLNTIDDWQKAARGKGPLAAYAATALGAADDYGKVMGGGNASDTARNSALSLFAKAASPEQRTAAIAASRNAVKSQRNSRIGNNQFLKRQYGVEVGGAGEPIVVNTPKGPFTFKDQVSADAFKKEAGIQ